MNRITKDGFIRMMKSNSFVKSVFEHGAVYEDDAEFIEGFEEDSKLGFLKAIANSFNNAPENYALRQGEPNKSMTAITSYYEDMKSTLYLENCHFFIKKVNGVDFIFAWNKVNDNYIIYIKR